MAILGTMAGRTRERRETRAQLYLVRDHLTNELRDQLYAPEQTYR